MTFLNVQQLRQHAGKGGKNHVNRNTFRAAFSFPSIKMTHTEPLLAELYHGQSPFTTRTGGLGLLFLAVKFLRCGGWIVFCEGF